MDPRRLLTFRAVAHAGSFSRAAQQLHLSQPSVSHQVALLETETATRLFDRGRGGTRLTAAGELLLEHADHVAWRLELADLQLADLGAVSTGLFRLGAFPTSLAGLVPEALSRMETTHPQLRVVLSEVTPSTVQERLLRGNLDLALSYQDSSIARRQFADARRVDLMQETFFIALPLNHPRANDDPTPIQLADLADDTWVVPSADGFLVRACRAAGFEPRILTISPDPLAMNGLVTRGLAVGLVPSLLAHAYTGATLRPVDGPIPRRDVFALTPPGTRHPLASHVIDTLREASEHLTAHL